MPEKASTEASAWGRIGANISWGQTVDRTARTAPARAALEQKFLDEADGDPVRAAHLRKAYYQRLALKSAAARRARREEIGPAPAMGRKRRGGQRIQDPTGEKAARDLDREDAADYLRRRAAAEIAEVGGHDAA